LWTLRMGFETLKHMQRMIQNADNRGIWSIKKEWDLVNSDGKRWPELQKWWWNQWVASLFGGNLQALSSWIYCSGVLTQLFSWWYPLVGHVCEVRTPENLH
jgi:hypothetical protein